jgi:hypothetical protein
MVKRVIIHSCTIAAIVAVLAGCQTLRTYELEVINNCGGDFTTVSVYVDGQYKGDVYYTATYSGISEGSHYLRAVGSTGTSISSDVFFSTDMRWTLCP